MKDFLAMSIRFNFLFFTGLVTTCFAGNDNEILQESEISLSSYQSFSFGVYEKSKEKEVFTIYPDGKIDKSNTSNYLYGAYPSIVVLADKYKSRSVTLNIKLSKVPMHIDVKKLLCRIDGKVVDCHQSFITYNSSSRNILEIGMSFSMNNTLNRMDQYNQDVVFDIQVVSID